MTLRAHASARIGSQVLPLFWRRALIGLCLVLFSIQGYMVQTHIHGLPLHAPASDGWYNRIPSGHQLPADQENCPICQAALHAGAFLTPAVFAAAPGAVAVHLVPLRFVPPVRTPPVSHSWLGRAPPKHL